VLELSTKIVLQSGVVEDVGSGAALWVVLDVALVDGVIDEDCVELLEPGAVED